MVHSCQLGISAYDGCNYTEVIAKPCEMMPEIERERGEIPKGERDGRTDGQGRMMRGEIGFFSGVSRSSHKNTFSRFLALFIPLSSKLKMGFPISHAIENPSVALFALGKERREEKRSSLLAKAVFPPLFAGGQPWRRSANPPIPRISGARAGAGAGAGVTVVCRRRGGDLCR